MHVNYANIVEKFGVAVAIAAVFGMNAIAQENVEPEEEEQEVIDEIVVTAGDKPGDPVDVDALYEEMMRDMLKTDLSRLQILEEEQAWRSSTKTKYETGDRIKWGYDPHDELQMRREFDMSDVQGVTTKPATVFRFEF